MALLDAEHVARLRPLAEAARRGAEAARAAAEHELRRAATDFLEQPALPVCREVLTSGR